MHCVLLKVHYVGTKGRRLEKLQYMFSVNRALSNVALFCSDHGTYAL